MPPAVAVLDYTIGAVDAEERPGFDFRYLNSTAHRDIRFSSGD
jgi:hypothetical protein